MNVTDFSDHILVKVLNHLPLINISLALALNLLCFVIFSFSKEFNSIPSMIYLSFISVFDTLSHINWRLSGLIEIYLSINNIYERSMFICLAFPFITYASPQISAFLLSLLCIDRFMSVMSRPGSILSKLPFGTKRSALIWSLCVVIAICSLNSHFILFNGKYNTFYNITINDNKTDLFSEIECFRYSDKFTIFPLWDQVNLVMYSLIPFSLMLVFNILLIYKTLIPRKNTKSSLSIRSIRKKKKLTISILSITFCFIIMTTPASIAYGFFEKKLSKTLTGKAILIILDFIMYFYHSILFINCFVTNAKFRKYFLNFFKCCFREN